MGTPYKAAHDELIAGIGSADKYHADWKPIAEKLGDLVVGTGFDPKGSKVPELIRAQVVAGATEAAALRAGANVPAGEVGAGVAASKKRVLALKTLRHLYYFESFGKQRIWILSLPTKLKAFPMEFLASPPATIDAVLQAQGEQFDAQSLKNISEASQLGLAWVHKAMMVVASPNSFENRQLIRRWFVGHGSSGEDNLVNDVAQTLRPHLQKIANGLKTGAIIMTDSPHERRTGSKLEKSEAFVYTRNDLMVVNVETDFFSNKNTLTGKTNWARIIVHELTHLYARTKDHSYSWQGLVPRDNDVLKKGNDAVLAKAPGFPAVRTLTFDECKENADTWAFFIADCAAALTDRDRLQALGSRLYDIGGEKMEPALAAKMKLRAGMK